ncbi:loganic acid O-methyltransferase-like [Nymphaea colorata]|nr:loganic acid O-methyltransferase-like [Nymphaea colorata]
MGNDGIPPMMGGCGENSYFRNSTHQRQMYEGIKEFVRNAVQANFDISPRDSKVIRIADLGCSVGPNTFYAVQSIIDAMCSTPSISQLAPAVPEFQVFFNDQIGNDFNMLFNSLRLLECRYFVAGVPGSFYERIFPTASIHFFNSAVALHWLSKAPVGASNKGRIHYYGGGPSVQAAYMNQFQADMRAFLESRAKELVEGGLLSLLFVCRQENMEPNQSTDHFFTQTLEPILKELILEGKMKEEELDSFQMPMYVPTIEEFQEVVEMNGDFTIRVAKEIVDQGMILESGENINVDFEVYLQQLSRSASSASKSVLGELLRSYFGEEILEEIFERFPQQVFQYYRALGCKPSIPYGFFILQLKPRSMIT